jgi:hypothetical protein
VLCFIHVLSPYLFSLSEGGGINQGGRLNGDSLIATVTTATRHALVSPSRYSTVATKKGGEIFETIYHLRRRPTGLQVPGFCIHHHTKSFTLVVERRHIFCYFSDGGSVCVCVRHWFQLLDRRIGTGAAAQCKFDEKVPTRRVMLTTTTYPLTSKTVVITF